MRAKTVYLMRCVVFTAFFIGLPILSLNSRYELGGWWPVLLEVFFFAVAAYNFRMYSRASEEEKVEASRVQSYFVREAIRKPRRYALMMLGITLVIGTIEYLYFTRLGELHMLAVFILPPMVILGLAGLIQPKIFLGARPEVEVPEGTRLAGQLLVLAGLGIGAYCCYYLFWRR